MAEYFEKMDPVLKARLVEALRSGRYQKGEGDLKWIEHLDDPTSTCLHCTMGVLVDLQFPTKWETLFADGWGGTMTVKDTTLEEIGLTNRQRAHIVALNDWDTYEREEKTDLGIPSVFLNKIDPDRTLDRTTFEHLADFIETYF